MNGGIGVDINPAMTHFQDQVDAAEAHAYNISLSMGSKEVTSLPRYVAEILCASLEILENKSHELCLHLLQGGPQPIFVKQPFLYNANCEECMKVCMQPGCVERCVLCGTDTECVQVVSTGLFVLFIPTCAGCKGIAHE